jgi:hypothetical protein
MEGSMEAKVLSNPFPGLRPFEADEEHLFFGREQEIDELLRRLRTTRFLLVAGSSGTGKSSLVRSGLIPALQSGSMLKAGSNWRIIVFHPGDDPIGNLAAAMDTPDALGSEGELASTNRVLLEVTLLRSSLGIVQAVRQAQIPAEDNVLIVVDQFEELFRFRRSGRGGKSRDEAAAFFKLLLEATTQQDVPIYIALTMRSDFLGDCIEFQGLPEAVNDGLYLIPRMTRDELRSAITGPVAVAGGAIAQRLVLRLLNDLGDDQDQLPLLQHALMRTWVRWASHRQEKSGVDEPRIDETGIDIADYEAIGGLKEALSIHAEEAFQEASADGKERIAERLFKALTDTYSDSRGIRRACSVQELAAVCEAAESEVIQVVEIFRRAGRSFLTPHSGVALESRTIVDLSHESLMRCWARLIAWTEEERESAAYYMRIAQAACWWAESSGGLWIDPQLETALQWRQKNRPTAAWAERYDSNFALAMDFLDRSEKQRQAEREKDLARRRAWQVAFGVLCALVLAVGTLAWFAHREQAAADRNLAQANQNLQMAENAVDESLSSAGAQQSEEAPESPETEQLRSQLLKAAVGFYDQFALQKPGDDTVAEEMAMAHSHVGDIDRLSLDYQDAVNEYHAAIDQFGKLAQDHANNAEYRQELAYCHNWLGETFRLWRKSTQKPAQDAAASAQNEYNQAIAMQQALHQEQPTNRNYQQDLARTYYNLGNLLNETQGDPRVDYERAAQLLEPLRGVGVSSPRQTKAGQETEPEPAPEQELARVDTDLGVYLDTKNLHAQAAQANEQAIEIINALRQSDPRNFELKSEAAQYYFNLACSLADEHQLAQAKQASDSAHELLNELAAPSQALEGQLAQDNILSNWIDEEMKKPARPTAT